MTNKEAEKNYRLWKTQSLKDDMPKETFQKLQSLHRETETHD